MIGHALFMCPPSPKTSRIAHRHYDRSRASVGGPPETCSPKSKQPRVVTALRTLARHFVAMNLSDKGGSAAQVCAPVPYLGGGPTLERCQQDRRRALGFRSYNTAA